MAAVHYYLGRPARVWISAHSRRSPARPARNGVGNPKSPVTAISDLPPDAHAGGLLARRRIAIARFGTDVATAGGIGSALAAGLDPADYPVVPGGVPQAWERAQVYLGLCERYQDLYQAQLAELHLLMAMAPGCGLPLPHSRPLTDPLTDIHTGHISLIRARRGTPTRTAFLVAAGLGTIQGLRDLRPGPRSASSDPARPGCGAPQRRPCRSWQRSGP